MGSIESERSLFHGGPNEWERASRLSDRSTPFSCITANDTNYGLMKSINYGSVEDY